jgi:hypothetical protein
MVELQLGGAIDVAVPQSGIAGLVSPMNVSSSLHSSLLQETAFLLSNKTKARSV